MVQHKILLYISFMLYTLSKEHFIPPPNYCMVAIICNHTSIPVCGLERNKHCFRIFLDDCDLYEYNCDYKAEYVSSNINNCNQITDSTNQNFCDNNHISIQNTDNIAKTTVEIITTDTTTEATTVQITTAVPTTTLSNITTCTKDNMYITKTDKVTEVSTVIVSDIDKNNIENQTTQLTFTTVPTQTEITISNVTKSSEEVIDKGNATLTSTTGETFTAVTMSTDKTSINVTKISTYVAAKTNLNTVNTNNSTIKPTTIEPRENKEEDISTLNIGDNNNIVIVANKTTNEPEIITTVTEKNTTGNLEKKTINFNGITTSIDNTTSVSILYHTNTTTTTQNSVYSTKVAASTTVPITKLITEDKMDTTPANCSFPSYCDRPRVWLTTIKGDTRDFYKIMKDNERDNKE